MQREEVEEEATDERRTEGTDGREEKITTVVHQAKLHILNGNHGNNYRADRLCERVSATVKME